MSAAHIQSDDLVEDIAQLPIQVINIDNLVGEQDFIGSESRNTGRVNCQ